MSDGTLRVEYFCYISRAKIDQLYEQVDPEDDHGSHVQNPFAGSASYALARSRANRTRARKCLMHGGSGP